MKDHVKVTSAAVAASAVFYLAYHLHVAFIQHAAKPCQCHHP